MLDALFLSKARIAILKTMLLEPDGQFYLRELTQKAGVPLRSAQIELKRLADSGILECETRGKQTFYSINEQCPIMPELRSIFVKTVGIADVIREALIPNAASITAAFIYGSFAKGDFRAESDIDLFVIGDITLRQLTTLLKNINVGRVINSTVMSKEEFTSRLTEDDHFISSLMNSPRLSLIGNEDGLTRLD